MMIILACFTSGLIGLMLGIKILGMGFSEALRESGMTHDNCRICHKPMIRPVEWNYVYCDHCVKNPRL